MTHPSMHTFERLFTRAPAGRCSLLVCTVDGYLSRIIEDHDNHFQELWMLSEAVKESPIQPLPDRDDWLYSQTRLVMEQNAQYSSVLIAVWPGDRISIDYQGFHDETEALGMLAKQLLGVLMHWCNGHGFISCTGEIPF